MENTPQMPLVQNDHVIKYLPVEVSTALNMWYLLVIVASHPNSFVAYGVGGSQILSDLLSGLPIAIWLDIN